jgi:esterase/lipase
MSNSNDTLKTIKQLTDLKSDKYKEIRELENLIKLANKKIDEIEKTLLTICTHNWEYEHCYGMYEKPDKVCTICDSRIVRF